MWCWRTRAGRRAGSWAEVSLADAKCRHGRALTAPRRVAILRVSRKKGPSADVAQLAEHLICNQAVASSILAVSSAGDTSSRAGGPCAIKRGGVPEWPKGSDCKSDGASLRRFESFPHHCAVSATRRRGRCFAGVAQLVERKPSKLDVAGSSPVSRSGTQHAGDGQHCGGSEVRPPRGRGGLRV